jgi:hypothetical protein
MTTTTSSRMTDIAALIRSWSPDEKEAALLELTREAMELRGGKLVVPVREQNGELLGYYVPSAVAESHLKVTLPKLTPEQMERTRAALANPDQTFDMEEFMEELSREDQD